MGCVADRPGAAASSIRGMSRRRLGGGLEILRGGRVSVGMQFLLGRVGASRVAAGRARECCAISCGREDAAMDAEAKCIRGVLQRAVRTFCSSRRRGGLAACNTLARTRQRAQQIRAF